MVLQTFIDKTAPTVVCDANTVVSLNTDGEAWLNANSIASDSYDNCSTITIRGRRMENSPCLVDSMQWLDKIYFCCEDFIIIELAAVYKKRVNRKWIKLIISIDI